MDAINSILSSTGLIATEKEDEILLETGSSGNSQSIWLAMENGDSDNILSDIVNPAIIKASKHSGNKPVVLYTYEGDLVASAEKGQLTFTAN